MAAHVMQDSFAICLEPTRNHVEHYQMSETASLQVPSGKEPLIAVPEHIWLLLQFLTLATDCCSTAAHLKERREQ